MGPEVQIKRCCVLNCSTQRTGKNDVNKTAMHKLPSIITAANHDSANFQKALRTRWLFLAGREEKDITAENEYVCGNHFASDAYHLFFTTDNRKVRKLIPKAEPSRLLPVNKENTASKNLPVEHLNEGQSSSKKSTGTDEKETNLELLPPNDEIQPVQASVEIADSTSKQSAEGDSASKASTQSKTGPENDSVTEKLDTRLGSNGVSAAQQESNSQSEGDGKRNGLVVKLANPDKVQTSSPMEESSSANTSRSASTESTTASLSAETTPVGPPSKGELDPSLPQGIGAKKVNGSMEASTKNDAVNGEAARTSALKRRFPVDPDEASSSGVARKRLNEEPKPQARMKICPRRSDLQSDAGAISNPDVVAGTSNKYGYLKGFTEALLNAAIYQLNKAFETRNTQLTDVFQQLCVDVDDIEKKYEDVTCRLNACKPAGATRSVGVQASSHPSALPTLVTETPRQPSSASTSFSSSTGAVATPLGTVKHTARRGRPPNAVRFSASAPQPRRVTAASDSVIDLTDDQPPTVSIVRALSSAVRTSAAPLSDQNVPGPASKFTASYSRAVPTSPVRLPQNFSITQTAASPASKPDLSSNRPGTTVRSLPIPMNQPATSKLLAASTAPQPVPVGSIFPGQSPSTKPVVAQNGISQTKPETQSPEKINVVGKTFRLPPGIEMKPVSKSSVIQPAMASNSASQATQPSPQLQQPMPQPLQEPAQEPVQQLAQQPASSPFRQRTKPRSGTIRVRHPAPLPETPTYSDVAELRTPPAPLVDVTAGENGIILTWDMQLQANMRYLPAEKYQIFTYTEGDQPPSTDLWRNIGTINALQLPMAVTLCAYKPGFRYYFAVRGVDRLDRYGAFNEPKAVDLRDSIVL